jgi:hypothetical protein
LIGADDTTFLQFPEKLIIRQTCRKIVVESWQQCKGAGVGNDQMLAQFVSVVSTQLGPVQ